ncbi:MAG TPA: hypothetical protein VMU51_25820 [Mycobacteriales bacterium]|nr:hypothetical protein [Mycobacteriales bacterium]
MKLLRRRRVRVLIELAVALVSLILSYFFVISIALSEFDQPTPHPIATVLSRVSIGILIAAAVMLVAELILAISVAVARNLQRQLDETALSGSDQPRALIAVRLEAFLSHFRR